MSGRPQLIVESATALYSEPHTSTVWISHSNTWQRPDDPIFHHVGDLQQRERVADGEKVRCGWDVKTGCGATVSSATWLDGPGRYESTDYRSSDHGMRIPIRWAIQFARPCQRCWP